MREDPRTEKVIVRAKTVSFMAATRVADACCWAATTDACADCMAKDAVTWSS
jgi:hypothetical protein